MSVLLNESSETITRRAQLVEYFAHAAKPNDRWLIGVEHEKFPYRLATLKPANYDGPQGLSELMQGVQAFGWAPIMEGANIIGLTRDQAAITFEPGGQVELAGSPLKTLHETSAEFGQHLQEVCAIGEKLGIGFLGIGFHPTAKRKEIPWVPKGRYRIMRDYMPKRGGHGLDMMLRTCTVQVNLDYAGETDMVKKFRAALAVQPVATALFASSPFTEGKPNGFNSYRMQMWQDTDPDRSGAPEFVYDEGFGYERYTDYALDVPMYFVYREGRYLDCAGQSFRDFMAGQLPALPNEQPTITDWANHLTTLFPDVRLKTVLEMRGADAGDAAMMQALPSFWVGLLYDSAACDAAWDIAKAWSAEDRALLRNDVPRLGLKAALRGQSVAEIARALVTLSQQGLHRRALRLEGGADESRYLEPLFDIVDEKQNRADLLLKQFGGKGAFDTAGVFEACRLLPQGA
jgi:glutamate--cysteine ligase